MKHLALLTLVACGSRDATPPPPTQQPLGSGSMMSGGKHWRTPEAWELGPIPPETTDLITATVDDWTSTKASLRHWRREGSRFGEVSHAPRLQFVGSAGPTRQGPPGPWRPVGEAWSGVIGRSGAAWGYGLHGARPEGRADGPMKHEGDGKSPAGVFVIGKSFGYAPTATSALDYQSVDANWKCVDNPASKSYAQILDQRGVTVDWKSAEDMRRPDELYTWVVELGHNRAHAPNDGSCIFMHVWDGPESTTSGCTAMPKDILADLVSTLPAMAIFVLLPRAEYDALKPTWYLP